jgi:hypothetical protein
LVDPELHDVKVAAVDRSRDVTMKPETERVRHFLADQEVNDNLSLV